ncbi:calcium/sodium antiporter [Mongoliitalea daihaiensis]|uniref:calcium/sodium antiporter n=1 Tax=Mongoliitalea daihaiensis TaxID=2782006 RepID=UPI001F41A4E5|nr:calcium/sodium antiporter [Mongoliitalea daihaiensis]UJP65586.1 calcium/sodium antiporter [Mongoliitalea daihaiensis]
MVYGLLILGLAILLYGGKLLVDGASGIASKFGLSPGLIGLTVVAFGTSAPELLVSINAALKGTSDIAIGNVVGSNIANIALVLGVSAILYPIAIMRSVLKLDYLATVVTTVLLILLSWNGIISRLEGIFFVVCLLLLNWYFFKKLSGVVPDEDEFIAPTNMWKALFFLLAGIGGLYVGSDLFVDNAVKIAQVYGVSERVIGVTIIAIGTSLPELVTSVIAGLNKKTDIAIGNVLGSNIMNILAILGITSIVQPIPVSDAFLFNDYMWMLGITLLLFPIIRSSMVIKRWEGVVLLGIYATYLYLLV